MRKSHFLFAILLVFFMFFPIGCEEENSPPENYAPPGFVDLQNGIVRDVNNYLEWQQATAPGLYYWEKAIDYCNKLDLEGYNDWRLPSIDELKTLIDKSNNPTIDKNFFPDTKPSIYWSSSVYSYTPLYSWNVRFYDGSIGYNTKSGNYYVRAVRSIK